jgi:hypothetical protein
MFRRFVLPALGMLAVAVLPLDAEAGVTCDTGSTYDTLTEAVADPECGTAALGPGAWWEAVTVDRPITIVGSGRDETVLFCVDGPCIDVAEGAGSVTLHALSVAGTDIALGSAGGSLDLYDIRIAPVGFRGGRVVLRDTHSTFTNVEVEVVNLPAIDAVSRYGSDIDLDSVTFRGVSKRSTARSVIYTANYGVSCTDCTYETERSDTVTKMLWKEDDRFATTDLERSASHPWPQLFCPLANAESEALCSAQCGGEDVALCRMTYDIQTENCLPQAVCVPDGEVPAPTMQLTRSDLATAGVAWASTGRTGVSLRRQLP